MYIRTAEHALDSMADILNLRDRRDRLVQSAVAIMLCLEADTRTLMVDCQDLFILGGLEGMRRRRRELLACRPTASPIVLNSDEGRFFEAVGAALDALRFAHAIRQIFPGLKHERWQIARAILSNETGVTSTLEETLRSRGDLEVRSSCEGTLREMIQSLHQPWMDRAGTIRTTCLGAFRSQDVADSQEQHEEADALFELFATSDERATELLETVDRSPHKAELQILRLREMAGTIRSIQPGAPPPPPDQDGAVEVA